MYKDPFSVLVNSCALLICKEKIFYWMHLPYNSNSIYSIVCRMFIPFKQLSIGNTPNQLNHSNGSQKVNNLFTYISIYKIIACAISVHMQILICIHWSTFSTAYSIRTSTALTATTISHKLNLNWTITETEVK